MPPIAEINLAFSPSLRSVSFDETKGGSRSPLGKNNAKHGPGTPLSSERTPPSPPPVLSPTDFPTLSEDVENRFEGNWTMVGGEGNAAVGGLPCTNGSCTEGNRSSSSYHPKLSESSVKLFSPHLRSNLMRDQGERDPLFFYEVVKTLGMGSMGSVARVRKRQNAVGGSARKEIQDAVKEQRRRQECLNIPIVGGIFRLCIDGNLTHASSGQSNKQKKNAFLVTPPPIPDAQRIGHQASSILIPPSSNDHADDLDRSMRSFGSTGSFTPDESHVSKIEYAMKSIHFSRVTDSAFVEELKNEISILKALDHPHIVRAIETFSHRNQIFIVMELCSGGDLYSRDPYTEESAARIVSSILSAVAYMHSRNICHRDLKYENILFVNDSPTAEVKVGDSVFSPVLAVCVSVLCVCIAICLVLPLEALFLLLSCRAEMNSEQ
jgi:hypothetical protein